MEVVKSEGNMFTKIPNQWFQVVTDIQITDLIRFKTNTLNIKGVDACKCFYIYSTLARDKSFYGYAMTTLKNLSLGLFESYNSKNIYVIRDSMELLRELGLVDYSFDIESVKPTDLIKVYIKEEYKDCKQFLKLTEQEFIILKLFGNRAFMIYCIIKNFYMKKNGTTTIALEKIADVCCLGKSIVKKEIDVMLDKGILTKIDTGHEFSDSHNKVIKSCSQYKINKVKILELWEADGF